MLPQLGNFLGASLKIPLAQGPETVTASCIVPTFEDREGWATPGCVREQETQDLRVSHPPNAPVAFDSTPLHGSM